MEIQSKKIFKILGEVFEKMSEKNMKFCSNIDQKFCQNPEQCDFEIVRNKPPKTLQPVGVFTEHSWECQNCGFLIPIKNAPVITSPPEEIPQGLFRKLLRFLARL